MSALDLQKVIYDALSGDADLIALLGGVNIFDTPEQGRNFPFVLIGPVTSDDWSNDTNYGDAVIISFQCWSQNRGRKQIYELSERICEILKTGISTLATSNFTIVLIQPLTKRYERDARARATKSTLRFRVLMEPKN